MLSHKVAAFLRRANRDTDLGERVRQADTYEDLVRLAEEAGEKASMIEMKAAFMARSARTLAAKMIGRGLVKHTALPPAPGWDQQVWDKVAALDLSPVFTQLVNRKNWGPERAAAAERRYRRFLYMSIGVPGLSVAPTQEIDEFWHQHILNTQRYASDCVALCGTFIHHFPSSGADVTESERLGDLFFDTWLCYETLFAEPYEGTIGAALLERWPKLAEPAAAAA